MSEIIGVLQAAQEIFFKFVDEIQQNKLGQIAIRRALKKYDVKNLKINNVTSLRAKKMFTTITPKYMNGLTSDKSWLENERRLFIWCTLCYLHKNSMQINDMVQILQLKKTANFQFLRSVFPLKQLDLIKFQVYSLVKKDNKNSGWKPQQDDLLRKLIKKQQQNTIQWSAIAKQFFSQSGQKYFRNAKQCRQRWLNYLDPKKEKGKWEAEQDKILLKEVLQKGKKWSKIVEALGGKKNEHMIKNRYKSLIHKKEKACKSSKINQNELIKMILKDYNQQIKQNSHLNQQDQEDVQNESSIQESFQEQQASIQKNNLKTSITQKPQPIIKSNINEPSKPTNFLKRWKATWPIIVQATHPQINPQQNVSKNDQTVKQSPLLINEVEICGDKAGKQLISNLFFSVNNSTQDNRIQPIFESRSPASNVFLASPYPAACWTPSLFFMEDSQVAASPLGGFGDFTAKTRSFTNFIADNQKRS